MPLIPLHIAAPGAAESLFAAWHFDPWVVAALGLAAGVYALGLARMRARGRRGPGRGRVIAYCAGLAALAVAIIGPLDAFNAEMLTFHMLQHLVMVELAAPLIVLGRPAHVALSAFPPSAVRRALRWTLGPRPARGLVALLHRPWVVFLLFNANLAFWHVPRFYVAALESEAIHAVEHAAFFYTALLMWWVMLDPVPRHFKASPHAVFAGSFFTYMVCDVIAAAITLATYVIYPPYAVAHNPWGIDALTDQRWGGGVMWVSGGVYFALMFGVLVREARRAGEGRAATTSR